MELINIEVKVCVCEVAVGQQQVKLLLIGLHVPRFYLGACPPQHQIRYPHGRMSTILLTHHPTVSKEGASGCAPSSGTRPCVGRKPKSPQ